MPLRRLIELRRRSALADRSVKEFLVNLFDVNGFIHSTADVVSNHQTRQRGTVDQYPTLAGSPQRLANILGQQIQMGGINWRWLKTVALVKAHGSFVFGMHHQRAAANDFAGLQVLQERVL